MKASLNSFYKKFYSIRQDYLKYFPIYFNFLYFYKSKKKVKENSYVPSRYYNTTLSLTQGHYKPVSRIIDLDALNKQPDESAQ